ncbi:MAG: succinate dehydrogenase [Candidatus Caenarcaniphilales bacterium]|nr:succinate dehydrogenase [Candidatus Caenarcaniphilales bacterium]
MNATLTANQTQTEFILRRLHSLSGLIPLGAFLVFHLSANNAAVNSPQAFNAVVNFLRGLPHVKVLEFGLIFFPFLFHGLYGLIITPQFARTKLGEYSKVRSLTYYLQRVTGIIAFVFIAVHVWQFWTVEDLDYEVVASSLRQPAWAIAYLVGILSIVYHFANGLWNFLISWGFTVGEKAQKISGAVCSALGVVVLAIGLSALWTFYSSAPSHANAQIGKCGIN